MVRRPVSFDRFREPPRIARVHRTLNLVVALFVVSFAVQPARDYDEISGVAKQIEGFQ